MLPFDKVFEHVPEQTKNHIITQYGEKILSFDHSYVGVTTMRKAQSQGKETFFSRDGAFHSNYLTSMIGPKSRVQMGTFGKASRNRFGTCPCQFSILAWGMELRMFPFSNLDQLIDRNLRSKNLKAKDVNLSVMKDIVAYAFFGGNPKNLSMLSQKIDDARRILYTEMTNIAIEQIDEFWPKFMTKEGEHLVQQYLYFCYLIMYTYGINVLATDGSFFALAFLSNIDGKIYVDPDGGPGVHQQSYVILYPLPGAKTWNNLTTGYQGLVKVGHTEQIAVTNDFLLYANGQNNFMLVTLKKGDSILKELLTPRAKTEDFFEQSFVESIFDADKKKYEIYREFRRVGASLPDWLACYAVDEAIALGF